MHQLINQYPWLHLVYIGFNLLFFLAVIVGCFALLIASWRDHGAKRTIVVTCEVVIVFFLTWIAVSAAPVLVKGLFESRPATPETKFIFYWFVIISLVLFWLRKKSRFLYGVLEFALGLSILWIAVPVQFDDSRVKVTSDSDDVAAIAKTVAGVYVLIRSFESLEIGWKEALKKKGTDVV